MTWHTPLGAPPPQKVSVISSDIDWFWRKTVVGMRGRAMCHSTRHLALTDAKNSCFAISVLVLLCWKLLWKETQTYWGCSEMGCVVGSTLLTVDGGCQAGRRAERSVVPALAHTTNHRSSRLLPSWFGWKLIWKEIGGVVGRAVRLEVMLGGATDQIAPVNNPRTFFCCKHLCWFSRHRPMTRLPKR